MNYDVKFEINFDVLSGAARNGAMACRLCTITKASIPSRAPGAFKALGVSPATTTVKLQLHWSTLQDTRRRVKQRTSYSQHLVNSRLSRQVMRRKTQKVNTSVRNN